MEMKTDEELWRGIANHFRVELGEEFKIKVGDYCSTDHYRFGSEGLEKFYSKGDWRLEPDIEYDLIHSEIHEIVKTPWKPKRGERYYHVYIGFTPLVQSCESTDSEADKACYAIHNCFKTHEEAETKMKQLMEVLKK